MRTSSDTMTIAALYDIHGNLPALETVLAEVDRAAVDAIVVGGDVVPGPMPAECLRLLLDLPTPKHFVRGNGDVDTLAFRRGEAPARVPEAFHEGMRWVGRALDDELTEAMAEWPLTVTLAVDGLGDVLFCHATPRDENEILTRETPEGRLRPLFEPTGADVVLCGHTHMRFDRTVGSVRVVNAGSVGMPFGEPGAFWALLGPDIELRKVDYDREAATERIGATGYPDAASLRLVDPPPEAAMIEAFEAAPKR